MVWNRDDMRAWIKARRAWRHSLSARLRVRAALDDRLPYHDGLPASDWLEPGGLDSIIDAVLGADTPREKD